MKCLDTGRFEVKYLIPLARRDELLAAAGDAVIPDPHGRALQGGGSGYIVHSTYFDTPDLMDYTSRLAEHRVRLRTRIRTYGAPGDRAPVFLELKRKLEDQVIKQRAKVCDADTWSTFGDTPWVRLYEDKRPAVCAIAKRFGSVVADRGLVPWVSVHYHREVYVDTRNEAARIRLTIDRQITGSIRPSAYDLYPRPDFTLFPEGLCVVELKFAGPQPLWMRKMVREMGLRSEPISKFALTMARAIRGDHPHELARLLPRAARSRA